MRTGISRSWSVARVGMTSALVLCCVSSAVQAQGDRPQTPVEPFPYRVEAQTVPGWAGADHTLGATLTLPDAERWGPGPYPGVVLVTGSGPQDRDETIFRHKPFLVIADYLTRRGIAVLRYDDRGIGESTGSFAGTPVTGLASDARAAWAALRDHPATDPARVGIAGHSEGGLIAPMVAGQEPGVAFLVLLAGTGVPGSEVMLYQSETMFARGGLEPSWIERNTEIRRAIFALVHEGAEDDAILERVIELMEMELSHIKDPADRERVARQVLPQFAGAWAREFLTINPREHLAAVRVPVLALNGTLDTQVTPEQNLSAIEQALNSGPCPSFTSVRLKGLNHLFQPAQTGQLVEYAAIETTFDEGTLGLIAGWISATMGVGVPGGAP